MLPEIEMPGEMIEKLENAMKSLWAAMHRA